MIRDVVIIGGGISGLALAIDLQRRGIGVTVLEKGNYPRHKVCGEYMSMESREYLHDICPALKDHDLPQITQLKVTSGESGFVAPLDSGGIGISRYLLESLLFEEAKRAGASVITNTRVNKVELSNDTFTVNTDAEDIPARLVFNATGRKSNLGAQQRKDGTATSYVAVKYHARLKRERSMIEIHNFPGGYCGVSDVENGVSCVCYIVNARYLNKSGNSIPAMEEKYLFRNVHLKNVLTNADFIFERPLTISGIDFKFKSVSNETSIYLGDSAGSIAPITGNGMSMGLRTAAFLSKEAAQFFGQQKARQQLIGSYAKFWKSEFSNRVQMSRHFQKLAEYPTLARLTIGAVNVIPSLANVIVRQTHGKPFYRL